jgi:hypothetical protein
MRAAIAVGGVLARAGGRATGVVERTKKEVEGRKSAGMLKSGGEERNYLIQLSSFLVPGVAEQRMVDDGIPAEVRAFVAGHIHTLMGLESLLLQQRDRGRRWTAGEVARELRVDIKWVEKELEAFSRSGLSSAERLDPPVYFYAPISKELEAVVESLAKIYAERRVAIIQLIFSKPADPIKTFADAFDFRKGKTDG